MAKHAKPLTTRADMWRHSDRHNIVRLRHNLNEFGGQFYDGPKHAGKMSPKEPYHDTGRVPYMMPDGTIITEAGNKIRRIA